MAEAPGQKRGRTFVFVAVVAAVLIVLMTLSLIQRMAPPGVDIVGIAPPADHHTEACYQCHKGIPSAREAADQEVPEGHPEDRCADCHEGHIESAGSGGGGMDQTPVEEADGPRESS
jgi:hypothetical protein